MKKVNKQLVLDYINGNDIESYKLEELENDAYFMKEVFSVSRDKNMYNLLNDNMKKNVDLIKYLLLQFKEDKKFIIKVVDEFVDLSENDDDIFEVEILLDALVGLDYTNLENNVHQISAKCTYNAMRVEYELEAQSLDKEVKDYYQMGFEHFANKYKGRLIIIEYIAKNLIEEIFTEDNKSLEEIIHREVKTKEEVMKMGINNFIINYVSKYDSHLAEYICTDIRVLNEYNARINKIMDNFDDYNEAKRIELRDWIEDYLEKYSKDKFLLTGSQLILYITKDLKLEHIMHDSKYLSETTEISSYDYDETLGAFTENIEIFPFHFEDFKDLLDDEYEEIKDSREYLNLKRIISYVVNKASNNEKLPSDYEEIKIAPEKARIIQLRPLNKNASTDK